MSQKEKSIKINYIFSIIKSVAAFIFPLVSFPYASRVLGADNLGIVSYATTIISYFSLFASLGMVIYATREGAKYRDDKNEFSKFCKEIFLINLISTSIVYGIFLIILFCFTEDKYFLVMFVCSLSMWFTLFGVEWLYQIEEDFTYISIRSVLFQFLSLILLLVVVKTRDDYVKYAIVQIVASGGSSILNWINSRKYVLWRKHYSLELTRHLKPIFTIFGISAASSIYLNLDTVMLKWIKSEHEVGLYTAAVKLNNMIKSVINSLSVVLLARLSSYLNKKENKEYVKLLKSGFGINLAIVFPCAVGMFMISKNIILILSGAEYIKATVASQILAVNLILSVIDGMIYYQILLPFGMDMVACRGTILGAVINIILNAILIPIASLNGAALATVLSELIVMCVFIFCLRKKVDIKELLNELPRILVASIPIVLVCYFGCKYIESMIIQTIVCIVFSVICYILAISFLHVTLAEEMWTMIKNILKIKKKRGEQV